MEKLLYVRRKDDPGTHAVSLDQIGIGIFVALALLERIALQLYILVDVLRLAPAERHAVPLEQVVGHAAFGALRLVNYFDAQIDRLEQPFQRGAIAMFGCLPAALSGANRIET